MFNPKLLAVCDWSLRMCLSPDTLGQLIKKHHKSPDPMAKLMFLQKER